MFEEKEVICTKRLFMRKPSIEYVDQFYNILKKEPVGKWLAKSRGMSKEEANDYIRNLILHWEQYNFGVWLLFNSETGKLLGHCGLRKVDETDEIEIMYLLDPEYWGNGYASEAAKASIQYAKEMMNEKRIIARVKVENENSKKLLRNLGFTYTHDVDHSGRLLSYFELKTSLDKL
ncbi:TPA: GNAT family N-acetyltransferase [Bacillus paranthracis]|uniref:GNAT family N-acetyltransferase n=1 Tax=Bacillus paranthracis TaxID=2026186 RepID=A0AAJ1KBP3_9BACI|nr:GNAT family N-acetyltransferase [Bacillus paranthracis]MDA1583219.1 GNAT family N-acetyltransferase [Bacillus cereus group sp. TH230-1LC]MDG0949470.1 GNAT family N-acetyltransferase [Bacillus paranthracis]MDG0955160.1 GNAT family N-acetyltransferase [Bacillus paranthracis]MED1138532.1 GNAT family N-acetyltransferase [Bacillus paranthracis]HDR7276974.1 GNAT family N-acetyltransferase [Bacillus paranthracis]